LLLDESEEVAVQNHMIVSDFYLSDLEFSLKLMKGQQLPVLDLVEHYYPDK